jgi:prolyl 4-hydroxylase
MYFSPLTTDVMVRAIECRIAQTTGLDMQGFEPSSIIGYASGQEYQPHVDYFNEQELATVANSSISIGGQRIVTFLICLQAPESGGETLYPKADLKVGHGRHDAMLHYNKLPDGRPGEMSLHHGLPIERGRKLILRTAIRAT